MPRRIFPNLHAYFKRGPNGEVLQDTQGDVARDLGISNAFLSEIKWGKREPNIDLALRIVDRCNVPLESLIKPRPKRRKKRRTPAAESAPKVALASVPDEGESVA